MFCPHARRAARTDAADGDDEAVEERTPGDAAGTLGGLLWLVSLLGVAMAAWLTQFDVVEPDE